MVVHSVLASVLLLDGGRRGAVGVVKEYKEKADWVAAIPTTLKRRCRRWRPVEEKERAW